MKAINYIMTIFFGTTSLICFIVGLIKKNLPFGLIGAILFVLAIVAWIDYKETPEI